MSRFRPSMVRKCFSRPSRSSWMLGVLTMRSVSLV
jgi:hypothetical protein